MELQRDKLKLLERLSREIKSERVIKAISKVPREKFLPEELVNYAYDDRPLAIGYGQTISQPLIVALMTQALELKGNEKILEIGTGSGYQTAILAELANYIISVERIPRLLERAENTLKMLGYRNISLHLANHILGWEQEKPYDSIMVTAAAPRIPDVLIQQLKQNGKLVVPVGNKWEQELIVLTKGETSNIIMSLGFCRFVPLIGSEGWDE